MIFGISPFVSKTRALSSCWASVMLFGTQQLHIGITFTFVLINPSSGCSMTQTAPSLVLYMIETNAIEALFGFIPAVNNFMVSAIGRFCHTSGFPKGFESDSSSLIRSNVVSKASKNFSFVVIVFIFLQTVVIFCLLTLMSAFCLSLPLCGNLVYILPHCSDLMFVGLHTCHLGRLRCHFFQVSRFSSLPPYPSNKYSLDF